MKRLLVILTILLNMSHSCVDMLEGDPYLHFLLINHSNHDIYISYGLGTDYKWYNHESDFFPTYPDTSMVENWHVSQIDMTEKGDKGGFHEDFPIEELFKRHLPADTLSIYIFHADTIANQSWDRIRDEYMVLKRYDLSLEDLKSLDKADRGIPQRTITYPPSEEMEGMRMYPR